MDVKLKEVSYSGFSPTVGAGTVVYAVFQNIPELGKKAIVFSGITQEATSTINAAEEIISLIAEQEQIDPSSVAFYDLETHRGYNRESGEFEFSRLKFSIKGKEIIDPSWARASCPFAVIRLFQDFIGPEPYEQENPLDTKEGFRHCRPKAES